MIQDFYEPLIFVERKVVSDGMGGFIEDYVGGVEFLGSITMDQSIEARIGEQQGLKAIFTLTTDKGIPLKFSDTIKRKSNGEYFRMTSNGSDMQTPALSNLDIQQLSAERFTIS